MNRDQIRDVFLRNGFTIKDGHDDLKDYVFEAAEVLIAEVMAERVETISCMLPRSHVVAIAQRAARAAQPSYYAEPFVPHQWVIDAIETALKIQVPNGCYVASRGDMK